MQPPLEDYALLSNCHGAALVSRDGSIDWMCVPRFDSSACFAALLGGPEHGRFLLAPSQPARVSRRYRDDTWVLETCFETPQGTAQVIDCLALIDGCAHAPLIRQVRCVRGQIDMRLELVVRFDYGSTVPWVVREADCLAATAGPHTLRLYSDVPTHGEALKTVAQFQLSAGEERSFVLTHTPSHLPPQPRPDAHAAVRATEAYWREWSARSTYRGAYRAEVQRSLLTLKALTYRPTGGIVAAPTTSLPEQLGGARNWDYRFCWLRDATITLYSLLGRWRSVCSPTWPRSGPSRTKASGRYAAHAASSRTPR